MSQAQTATDHDEMRAGIERRRGRPSAEGGDGILAAPTRPAAPKRAASRTKAAAGR